MQSVAFANGMVSLTYRLFVCPRLFDQEPDKLYEFTTAYKDTRLLRHFV
jgi:hypothetical protein